jgi:hypothetical protein
MGRDAAAAAAQALRGAKVRDTSPLLTHRFVMQHQIICIFL